MNRFLSVYFDLVRFVCAVSVVFYHLWPFIAPGSTLIWPGHQPVIVFFVLSGFVVAYVAANREASPKHYAASRLSRLWSVSVPAIVLGLAGNWLIGPTSFSGVAPAAADLADGVWRSVINLLFLGQIWRMNTPPPLNIPFWSLNYEAWYYAIFGAWTLLAGSRRHVVALLLAAIAGPSILILMPCWLAGVWLYRGHRKVVLSRGGALACFLASGALILFLLKSDPTAAFQNWLQTNALDAAIFLAWSQRFAGDYVLAAAVTAHFWSATQLGHHGDFLGWAETPIRKAAGYTLSIYLYHVPLAAILIGLAGLHGFALGLAVFAGIVALAHLTELRRQGLRRALLDLFDAVQDCIGAQTPGM